MKNLGLMQGRLIPDENGKIQSFPRSNWRLEFPILKELGINYLEWTLDFDELWKNPILNPNSLEEIRALCEFNQVKIHSATADNLMQAPIHKSYNLHTTSVQECIDFLAHLNDAGIRTVIWPLVDSGNLDSKEEFERFIELFEPISNFLKKVRIRIAFETDLPPEYNLRLITEIKCESVGINLDIGNTASYGGTTSREFEVLGSLIQHVHVKDRQFRGKTVPLGSGDVDWIDTMNALNSNYRGIRVLQTARKLDNIQAIREYLNFCEKVGL
jgi:L-ribulose-5-phosphate 3-epimerase